MGSALDAYDFALPSEQIAQEPLAERDASRLMVLRRGKPGWEHRRFSDLPDLLSPRSVMVFNNTRVFPARLVGVRPGGSSDRELGTQEPERPVEALLVEEVAPGRWRAMVKPARRLKPGQAVVFGEGVLPARCVERTPEGHWLLDFDDPPTFRERLEQAGLTPLPPYIRRPKETHLQDPRDREAYQTVYASRTGAVAAPTAGLHFTPELLGRLDTLGHTRVELTLHVGPGTFAPVQVDDPAKHPMHGEWFEIGAPAAERVTRARTSGEPVIAVGTTAVRSLESWAIQGFPPGFRSTTHLFIYPPFSFQAVHGMITNFHLPKSTLLMLVSAFHGQELVLEAYRAAVADGYRFFSYGDAMLILP